MNIQIDRQNELKHFGVPGMKWGIRKEKETSERKRSQKTEQKQAKQKTREAMKAEREWMKKTSKTLIKNKMSTVMNENQAKINKAYEELAASGLRGKTLTNTYQEAVAMIINQSWAKDPSTYSPGGGMRIGMNTQTIYGNVYLSPGIYLISSEIEHANTKEKLTRSEEDYGLYRVSEDGKLIEVNVDEEIKHSVDDFLKHFGVPGMKWGIRKDRGSTGKIRSEEHKRTRELKKKSISEMSNVELRALTERMNLEQQYKRLSSEEVSKGQKVATKIIGQIGTEIIKEVVKGKVKKALNL